MHEIIFLKRDSASQLRIICTKNHNGDFFFFFCAVTFVNGLIPAPSGCVVAAPVISGHEQDEACR